MRETIFKVVSKNMPDIIPNIFKKIVKRIIMIIYVG